MRRSAVFVVRAIAVVVAAYALWRICVLPYRAIFLETTIAARSTAADRIGGQRGVIMARQNLHELAAIEPERRLSPSWYMLYAENCTTLGRWHEAIDLYDRALRIDQRPEIYFNRGLVRLHLGDANAGIADMATAVRFNENLLDNIEGELRLRVAAAAAQR